MVGGGARAQAEHDEAGGLTGVGAGIRRRWRWVVWPTVAAMLAASVFAVLASPSYLQSQAEAKANAAAAEGASHSRKIGELRAKAAEADARVEAFRTERGAPGDPSAATAPVQALAELNARLAAARSAEAAATEKADLLRKLEREGRLDEAPDPIADESMRHLLQQRGTVQAEIADASRTLLPLHPRMKELNAEQAGLDAHIGDAAARTLRILENDARLSHDQAASLSEALAQQPNAAQANDQDLARLHALERDAKAAHDALDSADEPDPQTALRDSDGGASASAHMISAAVPPRMAAFSQVWRTILLATLAALVLSTGAAAAAALAARRREPPAAPIALSSPPAAATDAAASATQRGEEPGPAAAPAEAPTLLDGGDAAAAETSRSAEALAGRLIRSGTEDGRLAALIAGNGCGRALALALETARRLAAKDATLLVDLGATQDWFADILEREETDAVEAPGLADLLAGKATFGDVIRRDLSSGLDVIPAGGEPLGDGLAEALAALTASYGCVVLHASDWRSPPARLAADFVDALVLAAPTLLLPRLVEEAREALGDGAKILPFAVTRPQAALQRVA